MKLDLREEIARLAYEIFEREGRVHGRDLDHWLEAERIVLSRYEVQLTEEGKEGVKIEAEKEVEKKKKRSSGKSTNKKTEKTKKAKTEGEKKTKRTKNKS